MWVEVNVYTADTHAYVFVLSSGLQAFFGQDLKQMLHNLPYINHVAIVLGISN